MSDIAHPKHPNTAVLSTVGGLAADVHAPPCQTARNKRSLAISTNVRYIAVDTTRNAKYPSGNGVNPSTRASGETGSNSPVNAIPSVVIVNALLGRLFHGRCRVRITNNTSVCVAKLSTNQPVWNITAFA
jgi:hypothetical protein